MKKILALLLTAAVLFTLAACGSSDSTSEQPKKDSAPTKEELLATAVPIGDFIGAMEENILRAEETYVGNAYLLTGTVSNITAETADIDEFTVHLSKEDLMQLSNGQKIEVVGVVTALSMDEPESYDIYTMYDIYHCEMSNGYIVNDRFELTGSVLFYYMDTYDTSGRLLQRNTGDASHWTFGLDMKKDNIISVGYSLADEFPVNHVYGEDIKTVTVCGQELKNDDIITVSAKVLGKNLVDVELISVNN